MRTSKPKNATAGDITAGFLGLTPNQVVGYNLTQAREWKGWTQDQLAEALEPYLGKRWSKASVSQAERSVAGKFIRQFTADEIVAFARALELPLGWFFLPPPPWADSATPVKLSTPDATRVGTALAELVDLVFGDEHGQALLELRLRAFLDQLGTGPLSQKQHAVKRLVSAKVDALVAHTLGDLQTWQTQLRAMANHLEDLHSRAKRALADDVGHDTN
jgi:transcriptional regulator with XRE-family HTH domain